MPLLDLPVAESFAVTDDWEELLREAIAFLVCGASCSLNSSVADGLVELGLGDLSSRAGDGFSGSCCDDDLEGLRAELLSCEASASDECVRPFSWKAMWGVDVCDSLRFSDVPDFGAAPK